MKTNRLQRFFLLTALFTLPALAQAQLATVIAGDVVGDVQLRNDAIGVTVDLEVGQTFTEGFTVITGPQSSATLVQSNGAVIILEENTSLAVAEFSQSAFDQTAGTFMDLEADPSTSSTRLLLNYGEATGDVKRLRPSSSYTIDTPTGSAGIRGTRWNIKIELLGTGNYQITISCTEGGITVTNTAVVAGSGSGEVDINAGEQTSTTFSAETDADGEVDASTISNAVATTAIPIPAEDLQAIESKIEVMVERSQDVLEAAQEGGTEAGEQEATDQGSSVDPNEGKPTNPGDDNTSVEETSPIPD